MTQPQDEITLAKEALGLNVYEQQLQSLQAQIEASNQKALFNEMATNYTNVPTDKVQEAIAKIAETNPQMAQMMQTTREGMELAFKKVQSEMKPKESPDEISDSADAGAVGGDFQSKLKNGRASEVDLGDFILQNA
jgi:hypothetical protein